MKNLLTKSIIRFSQKGLQDYLLRIFVIVFMIGKRKVTQEYLRNRLQVYFPVSRLEIISASK